MAGLGGTPVIFLTAKGMTADRIEGFQAGCDDYIPKPFSADEVLLTLRKAEEREQFKEAMERIGLEVCRGRTVKNIDDARAVLEEVGLSNLRIRRFPFGSTMSYAVVE